MGLWSWGHKFEPCLWCRDYLEIKTKKNLLKTPTKPSTTHNNMWVSESQCWSLLGLLVKIKCRVIMLNHRSQVQCAYCLTPSTQSWNTVIRTYSVRNLGSGGAPRGMKYHVFFIPPSFFLYLNERSSRIHHIEEGLTEFPLLHWWQSAFLCSPKDHTPSPIYKEYVHL